MSKLQAKGFALDIRGMPSQHDKLTELELEALH
jgi:hypothetical protein